MLDNEESKTNAYDLLFVEDEQMIRDNYVTYLSNYFRTVYAAENAEIAYDIYMSKRPHILIVDINLPGMNGIELLTKIRKHDHTVKAIMLTARSDTDMLLQATSLKLTKYLVKPISRMALKSALTLAVDEIGAFTVESKKRVVLKEGYYWDRDSMLLINNEGSEVSITKKEQQIIQLLTSYIKKVFTYEEIIDELWSEYDDKKRDSLKTILKDLRKKLPQNSIKNIFGQGYQFVI